MPYARNARTHSDAQVAQIAASIREFGFTNPILVDGEHGVLAGHGRLLRGAVHRHRDDAGHRSKDAAQALSFGTRPRLDRGNCQAGQSLFRMATEGNNVAAAIFWMKARAGWREKHDIEISGKGGEPIELTTISTTDPIEASRAYQRMISGD